MTLRRTPGKRAHLVFRIVATVTLITAFAQITLGGIVRVTGSGLGCPDWPLCHGSLVPQLEFATLIEYSHRISASTLGVLMLGLVVLGWIFYRTNRRIVVPSLFGLVLVVVASILGGLTVLTELSWWIRLLHLGIAELTIACIVIVLVVACRNSEALEDPMSVGVEPGECDRFVKLLLATITGVFLLIISGSYVVGYGAGSSCDSWPLCRGSLFPDGTVYAIHMGHRYMAALVGAMVIGVAVLARYRSPGQPLIAQAGLFLGVVFVLEILLGAAIIWSDFANQLKVLHLSMATLIWTALIFLVTIGFITRRLLSITIEEGLESMPELERRSR